MTPFEDLLGRGPERVGERLLERDEDIDELLLGAGEILDLLVLLLERLRVVRRASASRSCASLTPSIASCSFRRAAGR